MSKSRLIIRLIDLDLYYLNMFITLKNSYNEHFNYYP